MQPFLVPLSMQILAGLYLCLLALKGDIQDGLLSYLWQR